MKLNANILSINDIGITITARTNKNSFYQKTKIALKNRYYCEC